MKTRKQHFSTSEEAELIRDTLAAERERKSSENSNLITNLRRAFLSSSSAKPDRMEKTSKLHLSIFHAHEKDVKRHGAA